jgi:hypothetical protein
VRALRSRRGRSGIGKLGKQPAVLLWAMDTALPRGVVPLRTSKPSPALVLGSDGGDQLRRDVLEPEGRRALPAEVLARQ